MADNDNRDQNKFSKNRKVRRRYQVFRSPHSFWYARRPLHWRYSGEVENLSSVISSFMKSYGMSGSFQEVLFLTEVMKRLGEDFIKHMRPVSFQSEILVCIVDSPVWTHQYTLMKEDILKRLNCGEESSGIRDIRFRVGNFKESQYLLKKEEDLRLAESIQQQALTEEDQSFLDGCVEELPLELRPVVRETLEVILKHHKIRGLS